MRRRMIEEDDLEDKALCCRCVGDAYLSAEIRGQGRIRTCSYCGRSDRSYLIGALADRVETVFEEHYVRTLDQPNSWQQTLLSDRDSEYDWERDGEPVVEAIRNSAEFPDDAAADIQSLLEDRHYDFDAAAMGEETEFSSDSHYEERSTDDGEWQAEWERFERSLKIEARFFSRVALDHLTSVFENIGEFETRDARPLILDAGPLTDLDTLYRARVFQSAGPLEEALCRPDLHLGAPPARLAAAGRMNARGISVFYGATSADVAVAEVRPPVGARVAVARFRIIRPIRLLDLTALPAVSSRGSVYDPTLGRRLARSMFLRSLGERMTRPIMPDDEAFDYLPTQAIADFLATESGDPLDGIIFPSAQAADGSRNVVLFHKAARTEAMAIANGTVIEAQSGRMYEEGWVVEYEVVEETPPAGAGQGGLAAVAWARRHGAPADPDVRPATLRVVPDGVVVRHVQTVQYATAEHEVRRRRRQRVELDDL